MLQTFDLYGVRGLDLESARLLLERMLGIKMEGHESSYRVGDYYLHKNSAKEKFLLQRNYDPYEEEWIEQDFPEAQLILYITTVPGRVEEYQMALLNDDRFWLLRRKEL